MPELIDDEGNIADEQTTAFLQGYLDKLALLAGRLSGRAIDKRAAA